MFQVKSVKIHQGMLMLQLSDGVSEVLAIELEETSVLRNKYLAPGVKVSITQFLVGVDIL